MRASLAQRRGAAGDFGRRFVGDGQRLHPEGLAYNVRVELAGAWYLVGHAALDADAFEPKEASNRILDQRVAVLEDQ
jgi:hypothetical protein